MTDVILTIIGTVLVIAGLLWWAGWYVADSLGGKREKDDEPS